MMRSQKGITLIALVITIIVMLILVGVTITMAVNGGLFNYAKQAAEGTQNAMDEENSLSSGMITFKNASGVEETVDLMDLANRYKATSSN